jgi:hypothetical protein
MKCIQRGPLTHTWTSSFGTSGRHQSVQADTFVGMPTGSSEELVLRLATGYLRHAEEHCIVN